MDRWLLVILIAVMIWLAAVVINTGFPVELAQVFQTVGQAPASQQEVRRQAKAFKNKKLLRSITREITILSQAGTSISPDHYQKLANRLKELEVYGYSQAEINRLRQMLELLNPLAVAEKDKVQQAAREEQKKKQTSQIDGVLPSASGCRTDRPVITHDFTNFSKIKELTAPGTLTGDRDVAKGHFWVWTGGERVPIYVPIDAVLESISSGPQSGVTHYTLNFRVAGSCSFVFRLAHITELNVSLAVGAVLPAGSLVGYTVGNIPSGNWDIGFYDMANLGPLAAINAFGMHRHGLCLVDYFSPEKQDQYRALLIGPKTVCK